MSNFANFFRTARERAELTQMDVAAQLGYSTPQFISNVERGLCLFPLSKVKTFIQITKCNSRSLKKIYVGHYEEKITKHF